MRLKPLKKPSDNNGTRLKSYDGIIKSYLQESDADVFNGDRIYAEPGIMILYRNSYKYEV